MSYSNSNSDEKRGFNLDRVPLTTLYERVDRKGNPYLAGRMGYTKVMAFATDECSRGERIWQLVLVEGPHSPEEATAVARQLEEGAAR